MFALRGENGAGAPLYTRELRGLAGQNLTPIFIFFNFPIIGKCLGESSNHWKNFQRLFQSLEKPFVAVLRLKHPEIQSTICCAYNVPGASCSRIGELEAPPLSQDIAITPTCSCSLFGHRIPLPVCRTHHDRDIDWVPNFQQMLPAVFSVNCPAYEELQS